MTLIDDHTSEKEKLFFAVFNVLAGDNGERDVSKHVLIHELLQTEQIHPDQIRRYIGNAIRNGQIFERKEGWLAKA